jgi:hypothetical protein
MSATAMKASATAPVAASTSTGASKAPTIPIPATTGSDHRTAIAVAVAPIRPAKSSPSAGATSS